jgi:hypothetical protein
MTELMGYAHMWTRLIGLERELHKWVGMIAPTGELHTWTLMIDLEE